MDHEPRFSRFLFAALSVTVMGIGLTIPAGAASWELPRGVFAYAYQPQIGASGTRIKVSWGRPSGVLTSQVISYVVWRGSTQSPLERVGALDSDASRTFSDNENTRSFFTWDAIPPSDDIGSRVEFKGVPGIVGGELYRYQVAVAYKNGLQDRDGSGGPNVGARYMSPLSVLSNRVTAIAPPSISSINNVPAGSIPVVNLSDVMVEWQQTPGADTYVIWVSKDPTFKRNVVKFKVPRTVPVNAGGAPTVVQSLKLNRKVFRKATRLFITVGARNSTDRYKPRPFGAIFSPPVEITPEGAPPPPP